MDTSRRVILKSALVAVACASIPLATAHDTAGVNDWLLIADNSDNLNRHVYSEGALAQMVAKATGTLIQEGDKDLEASMFNILGAVTDSRLSGSRVFVKVKWFKRHPSGGFLTPTGMGSAQQEGDITRITDYKLLSLSWNKVSAFREATPLNG